MRKSRAKRWIGRLFVFCLFLAIIVAAWYHIRIWMRPPVPEPSPAASRHAANVKILRDEWGVPHIFGQTDANTAFGLAYANAEDDWPTMQLSLSAAQGRLALLLPFNEMGAINDYMVHLLQLPRRLDQQYETLLSEDFRKVLDAYAEGLNFYAYHHPEDVDTRFFPLSGRDIIAGFLHKIPLMQGVSGVLEKLYSQSPERLQVGRPVQAVKVSSNQSVPLARFQLTGSNTHAVGKRRSADGITRLNVNSHQPWEGPVTWYEAHLVSEEGWNMLGGTFPGSPMIFHGHNQYLGWAHTVNGPDMIDVYKLTMHPNDSMRYQMDGRWLPLSQTQADIELDLGLFTYTVSRDVFESVHGPVLKLEGGYYAIRYSGMDGHAQSAEQWFRMNKARNIDEWKNAMKMLGLPMMNTMYADRDNILYVYNTLLPVRNDKFDYMTILPGNTSENVWKDYYPFEALPMVENPPSDYLMNTNTTPFQTTVGEGNPQAADFPKANGIETRMNNRSLRSHELFGTDKSITREEFFRYKFDRTYSKNSEIFKDVVHPLINSYTPQNDDEKQALNILHNWDGRADENSVGCTLASLVFQPIFKTKNAGPLGKPVPSLVETFKKAVAFLKDEYGRIDVPLGEIQRLHRGQTDLPIGGSMDTLNAVHTKRRGDKLVGVAGDSYILIAEFSDLGVESWALHQYGNVNRPDSVHYDDQAPLFRKRSMRRSLLTLEAIREKLEAEYHPGEENK
ncbi:MAG: acylase [Proteobacteria bacterium]|nr:acylase [Pseudomonadota bacterium]